VLFASNGLNAPEGMVFATAAPEPSNWMTLLIGGAFTAIAGARRRKSTRRPASRF